MISVVLQRKTQCGYVRMLHSLGTAFVSCNTRVRHQQHRSELEGGTFVPWSAIIHTLCYTSRHKVPPRETSKLHLGYKYSIRIGNTRLRHQQYRSERDGGTFMSWSAIMYNLSYTSRHRASQRIANHIRSRFCLQLHRKGNVQMPSVHWSFKIRINSVQLAAAICSFSKSKCQQQVRFHAMSPQRLWVHSQSHVTAVNIRCTGRRNYSVQFSPANSADVNVL